MTELEYALMQIQPNQVSTPKEGRAKRVRQSKALLKAVTTVPATVVITALSTTALLAIVSGIIPHSEKKPETVVPPVGGRAASTTGEKVDIEDLAARNRRIRKNFEGGDEALIDTLRGGDLGMTRVDLSEASPKIHDKSGVFLGKLKSLHELNLDENQIGNSTLFAIEALPIQKLELRRTNITDRGVKFQICNHMDDKLKELALTGCESVGSESIRAIGDHLHALRNLYITSLKFDNESFANLKKLSLHHLYAELTDINDDGLHALSDMTSLTKLKLNSTQITDRGITYLANLKELDELGLADTKISDKGIAELANLTDLEVLNLGLTGIGAQGLASLAPLKNLHSLYLYNTRLDDQALKSLVNFQELTYLNLADNGTITDGALDTICRLPKLKWLDIGGNKITDKGLAKLASMHHLETLILYDCPVTIDGVRKLQKSNPELNIKLLYPHKNEELYWKDPRVFKDYPDS